MVKVGPTRWHALPLAAAVGLVVPGLIAFTPPVTAAGPGTAPWWEPDGPSAPGDLAHGWNLRAFLRVTNPFGATTNLPVQAELDFGALAVQSGWPSETVGGRSIPKAFQLDTDSIRVVEYTPNFAGVRGPVGATFETGWREQAQQGAFNARFNAVGTVTWIIGGSLAAGEQRYFVVYFEALENDDKPSATYSEAELDGLVGRDWIGRGTSFAHVASPDTFNRLRLTALAPTTVVHVYEVFGGSEREYTDSKTGDRSPFRIDAKAATILVSTKPSQAYKVVSDKPILAAAECKENPTATPPGSVWIPSTDATIRGRDFLIDSALFPTVWVFNADPDQDQPTILAGSTYGPDAWDGDRLLLTGVTSIHVQQGPPVLVASAPTAMDPYAPYVADDGGSSGPRLLGPLAQDASFIIGSSDNAAQVQGFRLDNFVRLLPVEGTSYSVAPGPAGTNSGTVGTRVPVTSPIELRSDPAASLFAYVSNGGNDRYLATSPATRDGRSFDLPASLATSFVAYAPFDQTKVTLVDMATGDETQTTLLRNQVLPIASGTHWHVEATKPIAIEPQSAHPCLRFLPGFGGAASFPLGSIANLGAERRGFAVRLTPIDPVGTPPLRTVAGGSPASFRFRVDNLGRWTGDAPLADHIRLDLLDLPPGWDGSVDPPLVELAGGQSATVEVRITPPSTSEQLDQATLRLRATSLGNEDIVDESPLVVVARLAQGVKLWFGTTNFATKDTDEDTVDPGETAVYPVRIKNTGDERATFVLDTSPAFGGWSAELFALGKPVDDITLDHDQVRALELRVTAGATPTASFVVTDVVATHIDNADITSKIVATTRLRADLELVVDTADPFASALPGTNVTFDVTVENRGRDAFTVDLALFWDAPEGWTNATVPTGLSLTPGRTITVPITFHIGEQALVTEFGVARLEASAVDSSGSSLASDELLLTLQVDAVRDLVVTPGPALSFDHGVANLTATIRNLGNLDEDVELRGNRLPAGFGIDPGANTTVPAGEEATLHAVVRHDGSVPPGSYILEFQAGAAGVAGKLVSYTVVVAPFVDLAVVLPYADASLAAGTAFELPVTVTNLGNEPARIVVSTSGVGADTILPEFTLLANSSKILPLTVSAPKDASSSEFNWLVRARSPDHPSAAAQATLGVTIGTIDIGVTSARNRGSGLVEAIIENHGTAAAHDVAVRLTSASGVDDVVNLGVVSPNESRSIILRPVGRVHDGLRVEAALSGGADGVPTNDARDVTVEPGVLEADGNASASPLPALLVFLALAGIVRRRAH